MRELELAQQDVLNSLLDLADTLQFDDRLPESADLVRAAATDLISRFETLGQMIQDVKNERDLALMDKARLDAAMDNWEDTQHPQVVDLLKNIVANWNDTENAQVRELVEKIEGEISESDYLNLSEIIEDEMFERVMDGLMATGISRTAASVLAEAILDGTLAGQEEALEFMATAAAYGLGYGEAEEEQVGE